MTAVLNTALTSPAAALPAFPASANVQAIISLALSEDIGRGDLTTEAAAGREWLISDGLPADAVFAEPVGNSTYESLRAAFPGLIRLVQVDGDDNVLLFAFGHRHAAEIPDFLQHRARNLERGLGLEFSRYLERLRAGHILKARTDLPPCVTN